MKKARLRNERHKSHAGLEILLSNLARRPIKIMHVLTKQISRPRLYNLRLSLRRVVGMYILRRGVGMYILNRGVGMYNLRQGVGRYISALKIHASLLEKVAE